MQITKTLSVALIAAFLAAGLTTPGTAHAGGKSSKHKSKSKHHDPLISGFQVPLLRLRSEPLPRPSGNLKVVSVNFRDEPVELNIYNADGSFNEESLDKLYHVWRCRRTNTEKPINPHLFELLSMVYDHFRAPIELVSGFRNQEHQTSYHFHGSASDIRVTGVDPNVVHEYVSTLDAGGMGLGRYPRGGFVHVDVRPEPSYRWTDRSPAGSSEAARKKSSKKRRNA